MKNLTKDQIKLIEKAYGINNNAIQNFESDAKNWIKAIKAGRMACVIVSVSSSGMSRKMKFNSFEGTKTKGYFRQYLCFLQACGFTVKKKDWAITVGGCGMDMVFHTNYTVIHKLHRIGMLSKSECAKLAQMTPVIL